MNIIDYIKSLFSSVPKFKEGTLEGILQLHWIDMDKFQYVPHKESPLIFTRHSGEVIEPEWMFTDGGSIPRAAWVLRSYSPWGYAPAFIIHDWIFTCHRRGTCDYSFEESAIIFGEILTTLMNSDTFEYNTLALKSMYSGVLTSIAREVWNTPIVYKSRKIIPYDIIFKQVEDYAKSHQQGEEVI